ncbi:hypothetical protein NBRC116592_06240 [Colwellia sp. KU-HH00111]
MSKKLLQENVENTYFELVDLRFYLSLKHEYDKALFLFLETMKYRNKKLFL